MIGPTDRKAFAGHEGESYRVERAAQGIDDEFYYVLLEPVPRPHRIYFGAGHATFVRTSDCTVVTTVPGA